MIDAYGELGKTVEIIALPNYEETRSAGYLLGEQVSNRPPTERPRAVFCQNDVVASGFYRALRRAGLRVPEDIAVAGFDGIDEGRFLDVPLTTVETPTGILCQTAVDLLLRRMAEPEETSLARTVGEQIVLPPALFVGGTT